MGMDTNLLNSQPSTLQDSIHESSPPLANLGEMGTILAETTCLPESNMDIEFDLDKLDTETGNPTVPVPRPPPSLPAPMKVQGNPTAAVVIPNVQELLRVIEQQENKIENLESKLKTLHSTTYQMTCIIISSVLSAAHWG